MVREFVTLALEARTKANVKVRQPLQKITLNVEMLPQYTEVIADELNVKMVDFDASQTEKVVLDTTLTPELIAEGAVRELMRAVQGKRKTSGLQPADVITLTIDTDEAGKAVVETHAEMIQNTVGAKEIVFSVTAGETVSAGELSFVFSIA
jgi:isoleucyl-tRNA synthetase